MIPAALIAWLIKHEDLVGWGACIVGALLFVGVVRHKDAVIARGHADVAVAHAETRVATTQGDVSAAAAAIPAAADRRAVDITVHTEEAAHAVETAPGAHAPLPADVVAGWAAGVDGLRDQARASGGDAADPGGGQPARAVPAAGPAPGA